LGIVVDTVSDVAIVTIARPEKRNALRRVDRLYLRNVMLELAVATDVRAVILNGADGHFCAGGDIGEMGAADVSSSRERLLELHELVLALTNLPQPTIAAVAGAAAGVGWSLALACDVTIAAPSARFTQSFVKVGLAPDGGAAWLLSKALGKVKARDLIFAGRSLTAEQAHHLGRVLNIAEEDTLLDDAIDLAREYAKAAPLAVRDAKRLCNASTDCGLDAFLQLESDVQPHLTQTNDFQEGLAAFRERRLPNFKGC
jgi:2-(1,2-epoxy-1,2-dihydrophenyl)acetyl-CoA isomerase